MVGRPRADPEQKQDFGDETVTQGLDTQRPITEALKIHLSYSVADEQGPLSLQAWLKWLPLQESRRPG